jgi:ABC-type uncharacterized transport system ATPase component
MLGSVEIKNFRGVKECKLENLSLINVLVGRNNSGKSTILDAIYWLCRDFSGEIFPNLREILKQRVRRDVTASEVFYGYSLVTEPKVSVTFNKQVYSVGLRFKDGLFYEIFAIGPGEYEVCRMTADFSVMYSTTRPYVEELQKFAKQCRFLLSHVTLDELSRQLDYSLGTLKLNRTLESDFTRRIQEVYGIQGYEYLPHPERLDQRMVAFTEEEVSVFSYFNGAGPQRGALILSLLEQMRNTLLLIEEIETYQHPQALIALIKHMLQLAKQNNVQLFITTHNYRDALKMLLSYGGKDVKCYVLHREGGVIQTKPASDPNIVEELYGSATTTR